MLAQKLFNMPICLTGLVTAKDLSLEQSLDDIYKFIINNLGKTCIRYRIKGWGEDWEECLDERESMSLPERLDVINEYLRDEKEYIKTQVVSTLDMSQFTKAELLSLVRSEDSSALFTHKGKWISCLNIFKDYIIVCPDFCDENAHCASFFFPQHFNKLKEMYDSDESESE